MEEGGDGGGWSNFSLNHPGDCLDKSVKADEPERHLILSLASVMLRYYYHR